jgi:hypothetical protein
MPEVHAVPIAKLKASSVPIRELLPDYRFDVGLCRNITFTVRDRPNGLRF